MWPFNWLLAALAICLLAVAECSWGSPGDGQYHIQTDEGPERYFRFQTDNGQFRKERRLQDGTVVGTEAWIDAAGFLRQKDYIADKDGYRILKSKTVFVGNGRHIEDAIKSTKSVPAQSGVLVDGRNGLQSNANSIGNDEKLRQSVQTYTTTATPPLTSFSRGPIVTHDPSAEAYDGKLNYMSPEEAANIEPSGQLGFDHYPDELPRLIHRTLSNSITEHNQNPAQPILTMQPPLWSRNPARQRLRPIAVYDSTPPSPISVDEAAGHYERSTPTPFTSAEDTSAPNTNGYYYPNSPTSSPSHTGVAPHPLEINDLENGMLPPPPPPIHRRRRPPAENSLTGEEPSPYDGVGVTGNGFRYVLPRQYHEEEQFKNAKRAGSFGYVDPFGIRRVVYYNASPGRGFVHRNNNRYVGLGGTPYDAAV